MSVKVHTRTGETNVFSKPEFSNFIGNNWKNVIQKEHQLKLLTNWYQLHLQNQFLHNKGIHH